MYGQQQGIGGGQNQPVPLEQLNPPVPPPLPLPHYLQQVDQRDLTLPWEERDELYKTRYQHRSTYTGGYQPEFAPNERNQAMFNRIGYRIDSFVAQGGEEFDNQIWRVSRLLPLQGEENIQYIAKVVTTRYHFFRMYQEWAGLHLERQFTTSELMKRVQKERDILCALNHNNIMAIITSFGIEQETTGFPYMFTISIMELMDGNVGNLKSRYVIEQASPDLPTRFRLPNSIIRDILIQMGSALNYMHNSSHYRVAHQAIKDDNILFKQISQEHNIYKLADFEESVTYPFSEIFEQLVTNTPFDFLPRTVRVYILNAVVPSPEYSLALNNSALRERLRTFPNDIWLLGALMAHLGSGNRLSCKVLIDYTHIPNELIVSLRKVDFTDWSLECFHPKSKLNLVSLLKVMTTENPEHRITSAQLVASQQFRDLEHSVCENQGLNLNVY